MNFKKAVKIGFILITTFLQSCMLGLGVGYSKEYKEYVDDSWVNPVGIIRVSQKVYENKNRTARVQIYGEHISSIMSQRDNDSTNCHSNCYGFNHAGLIVEFGSN